MFSLLNSLENLNIVLVVSDQFCRQFINVRLICYELKLSYVDACDTSWLKKVEQVFFAKVVNFCMK
jgi:hypothetical protein